MRAQADDDGDVYLPNPEPDGPVENLLICMEPSLGSWARTKEQAHAKVEAGFRNFLDSIETAILHFCVRRYLCRPNERYHITDFSKGAMLVAHAGLNRATRYDRWYELLQEEIALVAAPNARIVAVGKAVSEHLELRNFEPTYTTVVHYSGQAGAARAAKVAGHEREFEDFKDSVSLEDLVATMKTVLESARVPRGISSEALKRLSKSSLSTSRRQLMFAYKIEFDALNSTR